MRRVAWIAQIDGSNSSGAQYVGVTTKRKQCLDGKYLPKFQFILLPDWMWMLGCLHISNPSPLV